MTYEHIEWKAAVRDKFKTGIIFVPWSVIEMFYIAYWLLERNEAKRTRKQHYGNR